MDPKIFGGLAQDAVSACTVAIQQASRMVAKRNAAAAAGGAANGGGPAAAAAAAATGGAPLDAQLFMIRNLLFLREQIVPFDVDFAVTDIDLDFSHMRDHLRWVHAAPEQRFATARDGPDTASKLAPAPLAVPPATANLHMLRRPRPIPE